MRCTLPLSIPDAGVHEAPPSVVRKAVLVPARNTMPASGVGKIASAGMPRPPPELAGVPGIAVPRPNVWPPSVVRRTLPSRSSR